ncbi:MAG: heavy-metal-associated domain-containing protein [Bilifractor sp.]|jgi:copper chaperone
MYKTTVRIGGMSCGMCEAHINDVIRKTFPGAKKVKSSYRKNTAEFLTEEKPDPGVIRRAIEATGYHFDGTQTAEETEKKKRPLFRK